MLDYLNKYGKQKSITKRSGIGHSSFRKWIDKYKPLGEAAFIHTGHNAPYKYFIYTNDGKCISFLRGLLLGNRIKISNSLMGYCNILGFKV